MQASRNVVGGLGNLMFIKAFLLGQVLEGKIPDTYVQQYSRWKQWHSHIKAAFSEGIEPKFIDMVAIHIRRGDYLKHKEVYVDLTETQYYKEAVKYFPDDKFLIFCKDNQGWEQDKNDRQWCRDFLDTFIPGRYELVNKDGLEHEDLNLMASCKARIGANSTFSWWACFLGDGRNFMPRAWFTVQGKQSGIQEVEMLPSWNLL